MPRIGEIARLEVKMIGKPYAGELHVRFDEGEQDIVLRTILNGHEVGNDRYSQELPNERCACSLLYPQPDPSRASSSLLPDPCNVRHVLMAP